jgi:isochorismate synthase
MENDFLAFRFPDREINAWTGELTLNSLDNAKDSFVFSDFEAKKTYIFRKCNEVNLPFSFDYHVNDELPYCVTSREYILQAHSLLNVMNQLNIDKVVYSRIKKSEFSIHHAQDLFLKCCETYPKACIYLVSSSLIGTWIGASPEILMEVHGNHLFTMSLAGTMKVDTQTEKTSDWGSKELHEQKVVTDFLVDVLNENGAENFEMNGPYDYAAGPVKHLRTDISVSILNEKIPQLTKKIHPSPAVSGIPRETAIQIIESIENHDRLLYCGFLGEIGENQTKLFVNLRCAQLQAKSAYLYVGGGFTKDSIPELELDETENKAKTLLRCMHEVQAKSASR